jgi:hypothetical protein
MGVFSFLFTRLDGVFSFFFTRLDGVFSSFFTRLDIRVRICFLTPAFTPVFSRTRCEKLVSNPAGGGAGF